MKRVVVTGSTRGIGLYMALEFLRAGCYVTLSGRKQELDQEAKEALSAFEGKYLYVPCNVQDKEDLYKLWDAAATKWGGVDIWINNAGQNAPYVYCWETESAYTEAVVKTNVTGVIFGCQVAAERMLKQSHGAIYSMEGLGSNNMIQPRTILYGTTKRALTYFMKGLAKELKGTGVIAGRLSPGMVLTEFMTRSPDGQQAGAMSNPQFIKVFNILGDRPETVAKFFIPRILSNTKNDAQINWLTNTKAAWRFMTAFRKRERLL